MKYAWLLLLVGCAGAVEDKTLFCALELDGVCLQQARIAPLWSVQQLKQIP